MPHNIKYIDGDLFVYGTNISEVVKNHRPPFYLGLIDVATEKLRRVRKLISKHNDILDVYVSVKTNDDKKWLLTCVEYGLGLEVVSKEELYGIRSVKSNTTKTIINGPGWSEDSLSCIPDGEVHIINIDSFSQLMSLEKIYSKRRDKIQIGIRLCLNPGGRWNKFGIIPQSAEWDNVLNIIARSSHIELKGLHFHEPKIMESFDIFSLHLEKITNIADDLSFSGHKIDWIDMGGGLEPSNFDQANIDKLDSFLNLSRSYLNRRRLIVELGKSIVNDVFLCVTKCVAKKDRNGEAYLFFDAGVNATGGGHANMSHNSFITVKHFDSNDLINAQLHGPMCFPSDIISVSAPMPIKFGVNDILIIPNSGAYTITLRWKGIIKNPPVIWV